MEVILISHLSAFSSNVRQQRSLDSLVARQDLVLDFVGINNKDGQKEFELVETSLSIDCSKSSVLRISGQNRLTFSGSFLIREIYIRKEGENQIEYLSLGPKIGMWLAD